MCQVGVKLPLSFILGNEKILSRLFKQEIEVKSIAEEEKIKRLKIKFEKNEIKEENLQEEQKRAIIDLYIKELVEIKKRIDQEERFILNMKKLL